MQRTLASTLIPFCLLVMAVCPAVLGDRFSGVADEQVVFGDDFDNYNSKAGLEIGPGPRIAPAAREAGGLKG